MLASKVQTDGVLSVKALTILVPASEVPMVGAVVVAAEHSVVAAPSASAAIVELRSAGTTSHLILSMEKLIR